MWTRRKLLQQTLQCGAASVLLRSAAGAGRANEVTRLSLREAGALLRRKAVSPVELTQACLARIEWLNPVLNAFITVTKDQALQ